MNSNADAGRPLSRREFLKVAGDTALGGLSAAILTALPSLPAEAQVGDRGPELINRYFSRGAPSFLQSLVTRDRQGGHAYTERDVELIKQLLQVRDCFSEAMGEYVQLYVMQNQPKPEMILRAIADQDFHVKVLIIFKRNLEQIGIRLQNKHSDAIKEMLFLMQSSAENVLEKPNK